MSCQEHDNVKKEIKSECVYSTIELVTSCDHECQEEISVEDNLLDDAECVGQDDDYMISVLSHDPDGSYIIADNQQVTDENGQLVHTYVDCKELNTDPSLEVTSQAAYILNLPYPGETSLPVLDEDELHDRSVKRFRLETAEGDGYDVILAVAGDDDELVQQALSCEGVDFDTDNGPSGLTHDKSSEDVNQAWFTTRDDKVALQNKGHIWKQGQWTKEEVDLLTINITSYCQKRGINDPADIIFHMSKDDRKDFYRSVAKGIERPLFSVYRRVIRMYDEKNYQGKYSTEELAQLRELRKQHGSDWAAIGAVLGRSASSVKDRCRLMKETCNTGKWFSEEECKLSEAVYQLSGASPGESVTSGLSWAQVAEYVGTRSEKQCRTKWLNYLNWKQKGGAEWTREDDLLMLNKLAETNAAEEGAINWQELADQWPSVRSPQWLRGKWWSMKRHIKDYHHLPFQALLQAVQAVHMQNVVRLPQYFVAVSSAATESTSAMSNNPILVNSRDQFELSRVMTSAGYVFNISSLGSVGTGSLQLCSLPGAGRDTSSPSFERCTLVNSQGQRPVFVTRTSSQPAHKNNNLSELMTSQTHTLFLHANQKSEVDDGCLTVEEHVGANLNQDVDEHCNSIQEEFQDFQNHFTSLDHDQIEIGGEMSIVIEENGSEDVDVQTGLMIKSDQMGNVEIMPLDDSYTEVIAEDLEINTTGDVITLVCSASNDGDSVPCFSDSILMSDSADLLGSISSDEVEADKTHIGR